jgi:opacity protein-like surface antigen
MNKAKLLILLFFIALATNVNAQFGIGLKGGLDFNSVTRSNSGRIDETYHAKNGADYGIILSYQINEWFALRANVEMLSRSHTMKRNLNAVKGLYTDYKNQYLTVPVMADFTFGGARVRGHFMMGGYVSYWMMANVSGNTFDLYNKIRPFNEKMDFNEYHNRFVAGLVAGPGLSVALTEKISLELDALLYYDLVSYMKVSKVSPDPRYNNTASLTLGVIYKL